MLKYYGFHGTAFLHFVCCTVSQFQVINNPHPHAFPAGGLSPTVIKSTMIIFGQICLLQATDKETVKYYLY